MISKQLAAKLSDTTETSSEIFMAISKKIKSDEVEKILEEWENPRDINAIVSSALSLVDCGETLYWGGNKYSHGALI